MPASLPHGAQDRIAPASSSPEPRDDIKRSGLSLRLRLAIAVGLVVTVASLIADSQPRHAAKRLAPWARCRDPIASRREPAPVPTAGARHGLTSRVCTVVSEGPLDEEVTTSCTRPH